MLAELAQEFPDLCLTMVGPDKDGSLEEVRARVARLGLQDRVQFPGRVPKAEVPQWLDRGDIFRSDPISTDPGKSDPVG